MYDIFFQPITSILTLKELSRQALKRLNIENVRDLLFYKPSSYEVNNISPDLSKLKDGELIQAEVEVVDVLRPVSRRSPLKIQVQNDTGSIILVFFNKIAPFIFARLRVGNKLTVAGKIQIFEGVGQISHPEILFSKAQITVVQPVYPLTYGIVSKQLYGYILQTIKALELSVSARRMLGADQGEISYLEELLRDIKKLHLIDIKPGDISLEINAVISRFAKRELFANQAALLKIKSQEQKLPGISFSIHKEFQNEVLSWLGFELTDSQKQAIEEIEQDQSDSVQMMRLLQGDVGSGKTLVALLTMLNVVKSGRQAVLMAPTDLLSSQHYQFFKHALKSTNINVALLTGKTKAKERAVIMAGLEDGAQDILIGTHALFQESVVFKNLGYVIIDEQHRFGVEQRMSLIKKSERPDVLVMTATPIPRSLSLTMFGEMSSSFLREKPKNRLPIITTVMPVNKKDSIVDSLIAQPNKKLYWICPLIENSSELSDSVSSDGYAKSDVISRAFELEKFFPGQVEILHGKIKSQDKDRIMQRFKDGEVRILVATTVIEVGIDVPDSTLIIIENAESFGLAALHQLRGRVGRGQIQSYCIMLYEPKGTSAIARKRLEIMKNSSDGFYIAEQDLLLRGGGEIVGTKQSGEPIFFFADLGRDLQILLGANKLAQEVRFDDFLEFQIKLFAKNHIDTVRSG